MPRFLTTIGLSGAVLAAICCFTPILPWILGVLSLSGVVGYVYRDDVLLPILAVSLVVGAAGLLMGRRTH